jgi:hypothetical protein
MVRRCVWNTSLANAAASAIHSLLPTPSTAVWVTTLGVITGVSAVLTTAQYQIWQGSVQKDLGLSSTQVLHLMSLPQGILTLMCSLVVETAWGRHFGSLFGSAATLRGGNEHAGAAMITAPLVADDIWSHPYSTVEVRGCSFSQFNVPERIQCTLASAAPQVGLIFLTCAIAVALNYSTIGVIGKTSAVAMQFVNQARQ